MKLREQIQSSGKRITAAMDIITQYGAIDGAHHKQWCLDQIARALLDEGEGESYDAWIVHMRGEYSAEDEEYEYGEWDEGVAP